MKSFVFFLIVSSMVFLTGCGYKADPKYDSSEAQMTNN